jgi:hypothetical protein
VIGAPGDVVGEQGLHGAAVEEATCRGALAEQEVAGELAEVGAEPARHGNAEAALAELEDLRRQVVGERTAECDLAVRSACLQRVGQAEPELEHVVIEERRSQLERARHRGDIACRAGHPGR